MGEVAPAWRKTPERGSALSIKIMHWLAMHTPQWVCYGIVISLAFYFTVIASKSNREATSGYLHKALGRPSGFRDRWDQMSTFAKVVYERVHFLSSGTEGFHIDVHGKGQIERLHSEGRGGVLLSAHFGSFEALRALDRTLPGLRVRYLMFEENAARISQSMASTNPEVSERVISVADGHAAMLATRECLDRGEFVAFLGDRTPEPTPRALCEIRFLGDPASVPRAPYLSAMMARVPILLCLAPRTGHRSYEITFSTLYDGQPVPRRERDATALALAQRFADALSAHCRRYPYNWFNFYDFWGEG